MPAEPQPPARAASLKAAARRRVRASRRARSDADYAQATRDFAAHSDSVLSALGSPSVVAAYLAAPGEPDPSLALSAWRAAGVTVLLPVIAPGHLLEWVDAATVTRVRTSPFAPVPEPADGGRREVADAEAWLVPALGIDASGLRLGQGGGYYDRALSSVARRPCAGVVFEDEYSAETPLPGDPWDLRVDLAWTPRRVVTLR